ncbi:phycobiliprotein lyase [Nostoc sp.]|uniref:Chromophore lyase CpcS/CpeS n=1 Tax=Nostoc punctiforme NIES-2108 TaxID=1356359 RepID=A0A367RGD0_NOSPU|nr:chorismate-binding protein [Nostoc punctiforme NIES-2108]
MEITEFFELSIGRWRSQRSAHHLAFAHFEEVLSNIEIESLSTNDPAVVAICQLYDTELTSITQPFRMTWEGESDWDDKPISGSTVLVPIPDVENPSRGKLLRDKGYAETIPAVAKYHLSDDGIFTLLTEYELAAAEERIWFANPNLRFRVAMIKTSDGKGVTTASFSSEIRSLSSSTS